MSAEELEVAVLSTAARRWLRVRKEREKPTSPRKPKNWITHDRDATPELAPGVDVPTVEPVVAAAETPPPPHAFMHYCHCGKWGSFGYGVDLLHGKIGTWYCREHRLELLNRMVVP